MELINLNQIPKSALHSIVAIGNFDGVHLGHRKVINKAKKISNAQKKNYQLLLLNHTQSVSLKKNSKNLGLHLLEKNSKK